MERELRRLGKRAQQDQDQSRNVHWAGLDRILLGQDHAQIIAACDIAQDQHAPDHRQPACTGHCQCHPCALAPFGQVPPIADQQKGRKRCQFPEYQQKQDVIRQDNSHHRALEQQQIGIELPHRIFAAQVVARIQDNQQTNAQDQPGKEQPHTIKKKMRVQPQRG